MSYDVLFYRHSLFNRGGDKMVLIHAAGLAERGVKVAIAVNQMRTVFDWPEGVTKIDIPWGGKIGTLAYALFTRQPAGRIIADIIPMASLLGMRNPGRVIYFCQDYDESYYVGKCSRLLIRFLYSFGLGILRLPVIAVASQLADKLSRFTSRTHVVPNGVDQSLFYPAPEQGLLDKQGTVPAILILFRPDFRKGTDIALKVIAELKKSAPESFQVWSVGEASSIEQDSLLVDHAFGTVDADRLRGILSSCSLLLYPTRHEGLPLMVLEAMSCGCVVVASEASCEIIHHGENGFMAPVEDVEKMVNLVAELLHADELREKLLQGGFKTVENHSMAKTQEKFYAALQDVVGP